MTDNVICINFRDRKLEINIPDKGEKILVKTRKSVPGPAKKNRNVAKTNKGGFRDLSYLKYQPKDEIRECEVTGVYPRFISVVYTDNSNNIIPTTIPYIDIATKKCCIEPLK